MQVKKRFVTALGVLSLLLTTGCATTDKTATTQDAVQPLVAPQADFSEVVTATFTVRAINLPQRLVTLRDKKGGVFTIYVGEEARNLPQLRVGDRVKVQYHEAVALQINRDTSGGVTSRKETVSGTRTELGEKPGGSVRNTVEVIANILAIDQQTRRVTLQGPERTLVVKIPADRDLSKLDVGEQVKLTYVEELAISVQPARGGAKPAKPTQKQKPKS